MTIDGSNSGGSDRSLTIANTNTSGSGIWLSSLGIGAGASYNTIKNCNITLGVFSTTTYGICIGGQSLGSAGADNDNITIQNNSISNAASAVFAVGMTGAPVGGFDSLKILNNRIFHNSTYTGTVMGMQLSNVVNAVVSLDTIDLQSSSSGTLIGIALETGFVNSLVDRNYISKCLTTSTSTVGAKGINIGTGMANSNITVSNNVITNVNGATNTSSPSSTSIGIGLGLVSNVNSITGGVNLLHNSVSMTGSIGTFSNSLTHALYVSSSALNLNLRNNIFSNTQSATQTVQKNYAVYNAGTAAVFATMNHNNYFVSNAGNAPSAIPGFLLSDRLDSASFITAFGQNVNSKFGNPLFQSSADLRPSFGVQALASGATGTGVTIDYLGVTRGSPPTMGAFENAVDVAGPTMIYTLLGNTTCTSNRTFTATVTDVSGVDTTTGTKPRVYFKNQQKPIPSQGIQAQTTGGNLSKVQVQHLHLPSI